MNENGQFKIRFSQEFERGALKLIEVSPEMAEELSLGMQSLTIRGSENDDVVIVNRNQTYKVNLLETSNTLLLVRPSVSSENMQEVIAAPDHHYDLVKTVPDLSPLVKILNLNCIDSDHLEMFHAEPGSARPSGVTMRELQNCIQASDEEIMKELLDRQAIEIQGYWFSLDMRLINTVLGEIIDVIQACSLSMNKLDFLEIATELADAYPSLLVRHVLNCFKVKTAPETCNNFIRLDETLVCRQIAIRILLEQPRMPYDEFMDKWRVELPGLFQADESYLKGVAYLDETSFHKFLCYIPIEKLPLEPKKRFDFLFGTRAKWPVEEMVAFVEDVVARGHSLESIVMRYTKTIQRGQYYVARTVPK